MPETEIITDSELKQFTCERCGYEYTKRNDYVPFLCHRCMRYIAKKVFTIMGQIIPPTSSPAAVRD
jgi:ribosomal protein L37AE/L43A